MTRSVLRFLFALTFSFIFITAEATPNTTTLPPAQMLKQVLPSIVNIKSYGFLPPNMMLDDEDKSEKNSKENGKPHHFVSAGSGIIINAEKGYVVTNAHVIKDADKIVVTLKDGQQYAAEKVGLDEPSDIALLKITAPHLTDISIANSNDLEVGDKVYAIGNPFGLGMSVTSGIVSALELNNLSLGTYENFIQTDAPINPGNSGGALINAQGDIVGMNTAIYTSEDGGNIGIGFAIPSNMLTAVIPQLIKYGKVERGIIGILAQTFSAPLANAMHIPKQEGAIVTSVMPYSPAEEAGIRAGDIITHIDGTAVSTASEVVNTVGFLRTGTVVKIKLLREGKLLELSVTLMDAKKQQALVQKHTPYFNGVSLQDFSFYSPENGHVNGVALVHVEIDSAAWIAGLRSGDIVLSANNKPTTNVQELQQTIATAKDTLILLVLRNHGTAFIALTPEGVLDVEK